MRILLIIFLNLIPYLGTGQSNGIYLESQFFVQDESFRKIDGVSYDDIIGSPYLSDSFTSASIYLNGQQKPVEAELRFNVVKNNFEFKKNDVVLTLDSSSEIDSIIYDKKKFIVIDDEVDRFYEYLHGTEILLLRNYKAYFSRAEKSNNPYESEKPNEFVKQPDEFVLVDVKEDIKLTIKNRRSLYSLFGKKAIKSLDKEYDFEYDKVDDLIILLKKLGY
ncbi:hypothetical protein MATR_32850 [Marivirga tractuosa]|uniref:Uncharacterized protein n=1 Tax=Marivirga tractuosa (strain ATCC 23168 / DSM 4126 / NBRC 15989 / NCIMB 1408 / VKM B-1430 / H-43) TaxID=643867 RepID=E4TSE9_MARTH|nr:hypothetical protein [Marivirga tractuosa]ADR22866.1 hypothetical protein Ftrac_2890 [Marivirga tractuosa DSM 4126]BDD16460.1 hypothetical protein MATR_32850 [Marivirga tractuosa]